MREGKLTNNFCISVKFADANSIDTVFALKLRLDKAKCLHCS